VVVQVQASEAKQIFAKALTSHECNSTEWHFVITQVDTQANAPLSIHVKWANGNEADVSLDKFVGGVAHYVTSSNLNSSVVEATAVIYSGWSGEFNLSHGPCPSSPTPTVTNTPTSTVIPTSTATNTPMVTATSTATLTSTPTSTSTSTPVNTSTSTPTATSTSIVSSPTPTSTAAEVSTPTSTGTVVVQTPTETPTSTSTSVPTGTPVDAATPTNTPVETATPTSTSTPVGTLTPTETVTPTPIVEVLALPTQIVPKTLPKAGGDPIFPTSPIFIIMGVLGLVSLISGSVLRHFSK